MKSDKKINDFQNEYYEEIENYCVSEQDFVKLKIQPKILAYEVYLRKVLGDKFAGIKDADDYDERSKRKIEKVSKNMLNNDEFNNILNDIETSKFDENVEMIVKSKR